MYFFNEVKANYYDCDCNNLLKISSAMKYMQQTSSEQLDALGFSVEKLYSENMVFLLSKMCIRVHRMPVCSERLLVGTAATQPKGPRFIREFVIESPAGERLLSGLSLWILVDPASRKILRPASFPYGMSFQPENLVGVIEDIAFPKRTEGEGEGEVAKRTVCYSHIDVNHHVNNTVYADFVCDLLPYKKLTARGLETLVIGFQNEARHGDLLEMEVREPEEEGSYHIIGRHGGSPCFEALAVLGRV